MNSKDPCYFVIYSPWLRRTILSEHRSIITFSPGDAFGPWKQREGDLMRTQRKNLLVDKSSAKSDRNLIGPNGYVVENSVCFRLKYISYLMMSHSDPPYCYPSSPTYQTIKRGSHLDFPYSLVRFLHIKSAKKVIGKIK